MIQRLAFALLTALLVTLHTQVMAAEIAGNVELIEGKVWIQGADNKMRAIKTEQPIFEGDTIITGSDGELQVRMKDDAFIAVRANSKLKIDNYRAQGDADDKATFSLLLGTFRSITGWIGKYNRDNYSINTRTATIGVRGTDHEPMYIPPAVPGMPPIGEPGVYDKVNSGRIVIKNQFGETEFDKGQAAFVGIHSQQAAVRLKGIPDFFKPSKNEQRIETVRSNLQMGIDTNMLKRQQEQKGEGTKPRPLLRPQSPPGSGITPDTKTTTSEEKSDSNLLPGKRPLAPIRTNDRAAPVIQKLTPEIAPIMPQTLPDMPTRLTPVAPGDIKLQSIQPLAPITPIAPTSKITPTAIQPQSLMTMDPIKTESAIIPKPVLAAPVAPATLMAPSTLMAPVTLTPQLAPTQTITQEKTLQETELLKPATLQLAPTLIQQPVTNKILLPAR